MSDDVPVQITLFPPTTDVETSHWGQLAPTLWHAGLIWRHYQQVAFSMLKPELRIWCTFTDHHAFNTWQQHPLVVERCGETLRSEIHIDVALTPFERHDRICRCQDSSELILRGHGFGFQGGVLWCCDCLGYYPNYRTITLLGDLAPRLQTWALTFGHVYKIWMQTSELESWASNELQSAGSTLNASGRSHAREASERTGKTVWYDHFVEQAHRTPTCPCCGKECTQPSWSATRLTCCDCRVSY